MTRVRGFASAVAALALIAAPATAHAAATPPAAPEAQSAIVIDGSDGEVMFAKHADERRAMASTTKLMTALLTLEQARPRQVFAAADYHAAPVESQIHLMPGERMTVRDLFTALMLESANDAAETLAEGIAGSRARFVAEMNARARELGLDETSYANPIGIDAPGNYSSARDLARLAFDLMRQRRFARVVDTPVAQLHSGSHPRTVDNRNTLIASHPFVDGVKTGHTVKAGYVLVGAARGADGGSVTSVVTGEPSEAARDAETLRLLSWGVEQFHRVRVLDRSRPLAHPDIEYRDDHVALVPARAATVTLRDGERVRRRVHAPDQVKGPLARGARVGSVTVLVDGEPVRRVPLVTAEAVPKAGTVRVLVSALGVPLTATLVGAILLGAALLALRLRARPSRR
jgi:serine-type D-Ala-D-Ala carboxypeptidase (penicillin-binding protein 5/6)